MKTIDYKEEKKAGWDVSKPVLKDESKIADLDLDTLYLTPNVVDGHGAFVINELVDDGIYHCHVVDGTFNIYTGSITIKKDAEATGEVQTAALGRIQIQTRVSSAAGSNINGVTVGLYGTEGDTTNKVFKKEYGQVEYSSYFLGTSETAKISGVNQDGYVYFHFIPAREYFAVAFHPEWSKNKIPADYVTVNKNNTVPLLLHFGK